MNQPPPPPSFPPGSDDVPDYYSKQGQTRNVRAGRPSAQDSGRGRPGFRPRAWSAPLLDFPPPYASSGNDRLLSPEHVRLPLAPRIQPRKPKFRPLARGPTPSGSNQRQQLPAPQVESPITGANYALGYTEAQDEVRGGAPLHSHIAHPDVVDLPGQQSSHMRGRPRGNSQRAGPRPGRYHTVDNPRTHEPTEDSAPPTPVEVVHVKRTRGRAGGDQAARRIMHGDTGPTTASQRVPAQARPELSLAAAITALGLQARTHYRTTAITEDSGTESDANYETAEEDFPDTDELNAREYRFSHYDRSSPFASPSADQVPGPPEPKDRSPWVSPNSSVGETCAPKSSSPPVSPAITESGASEADLPLVLWERQEMARTLAEDLERARSAREERYADQDRALWQLVAWLGPSAPWTLTIFAAWVPSPRPPRKLVFAPSPLANAELRVDPPEFREKRAGDVRGEGARCKAGVFGGLTEIGAALRDVGNTLHARLFPSARAQKGEPEGENVADQSLSGDGSAAGAPPRKVVKSAAGDYMLEAAIRQKDRGGRSPNQAGACAEPPTVNQVTLPNETDEVTRGEVQPPPVRSPNQGDARAEPLTVNQAILKTNAATLGAARPSPPPPFRPVTRSARARAEVAPDLATPAAGETQSPSAPVVAPVVPPRSSAMFILRPGLPNPNGAPVPTIFAFPELGDVERWRRFCIPPELESGFNRVLLDAPWTFVERMLLFEMIVSLRKSRWAELRWDRFTESFNKTNAARCRCGTAPPVRPRLPADCALVYYLTFWSPDLRRRPPAIHFYYWRSADENMFLWAWHGACVAMGHPMVKMCHKDDIGYTRHMRRAQQIDASRKRALCVPKETFGDRKTPRPSKLPAWFACDALKPACVQNLVAARDEEPTGMPAHLRQLKAPPAPRGRLY